MKISIITLFPEVITPYLNTSILKRAQDKGLVEYEVINLRDFGEGKHKVVDGRPYGGGAGMVLRADILTRALKSVLGPAKFKISNLKFQRGATLMELVVVVGISALVVGALVFVTVASLRNAQISRNQIQATKLAQEGMEWVRLGRNENSEIRGNFMISSQLIDKWNSSALWSNNINGNCGDGVSTFCYFTISQTGILDHKGALAAVPGNDSIGSFRRAVILTDDASSYQTQKTVIVVVEWGTGTNKHQSRLTTILRKL